MLTDIVMPDRDGIALAPKIARNYPDLKVLMMARYTREQQRVNNLNRLTQEEIPKPFAFQ